VTQKDSSVIPIASLRWRPHRGTTEMVYEYVERARAVSVFINMIFLPFGPVLVVFPGLHPEGLGYIPVSIQVRNRFEWISQSICVNG
jgi:hypothetical protein